MASFSPTCIPVIHIGQGSSNFFSNLIQAYLKNHTIVQVMACGRYINLSVWVLSIISKDYFTSGMHVDQTTGALAFVFYVHNIRHDIPIRTLVCENHARYIKIGKYTNAHILEYLLSTRSSADLLAAGSSCHILCHMILHAYTMGFHIEHVQPIKTADTHGVEKAGLRIYIRRQCSLVNEPLSQLPS